MQAEQIEMQRRATCRAGQEVACKAADHGHDRADGEIEARHQDRDGLCHRQHGERKNFVAILHQHGRGETAGMGDIVENVEGAEQQDSGDKTDVLADPDGEIVKHAEPALRHRCRC
ncbi:hypothetical protein [Bradyrhizobium sp. RDM4]|uniref:hypothetical protein n=1 Tax=Bradyrhizobium sp. RDM4 TaxID=3378765 RepID=UPI0038FC10B2